MSAAASSKRSPLTFFVLTLALASPFWILGSVVNASGGSDGPPVVQLRVPRADHSGADPRSQEGRGQRRARVTQAALRPRQDQAEDLARAEHPHHARGGRGVGCRDGAARSGGKRNLLFVPGDSSPLRRLLHRWYR